MTFAGCAVAVGLAAFASNRDERATTQGPALIKDLFHEAGSRILGASEHLSKAAFVSFHLNVYI
ncbi:MAG: hypothetical protein DRH12_14150 [Deltaproteobacteria bacterium]|nr:MAG: hypothetical protein DRH12_14150 [Deltaproteobacteria bacterium]